MFFLDLTSVPSSVPLFDIVNTDPAGGALRPALRQTMAGAEEVLCALRREGRNPLAMIARRREAKTRLSAGLRKVVLFVSWEMGSEKKVDGRSLSAGSLQFP